MTQCRPETGKDQAMRCLRPTVCVFLMCWVLDGRSFLFALEDEGKKTPPPALEIVEGGGRNPFALPKGVYPRSKLTSAAEKEKKEKPLALEAIVTIDGNRQRASISGMNVEEGDEVSGKKVLAIGKDFVVLEGAIENMRLELKRRPFSIGVREETGDPKKMESEDGRPEAGDKKPAMEKEKGIFSWIENFKKSK